MHTGIGGIIAFPVDLHFSEAGGPALCLPYQRNKGSVAAAQNVRGHIEHHFKLAGASGRIDQQPVAADKYRKTVFSYAHIRDEALYDAYFRGALQYGPELAVHVDGISVFNLRKLLIIAVDSQSEDELARLHRADIPEAHRGVVGVDVAVFVKLPVRNRVHRQRGAVWQGNVAVPCIVIVAANDLRHYRLQIGELSHKRQRLRVIGRFFI